MKRIDVAKLRKNAGLSQQQLADMLRVRPSFLSAIENGRSRLPEEKMLRIKEIFRIDNFDDYLIENTTESVIPPHSHNEPVDSLANLINQFHDLAHRNHEATHHSHDHNGNDSEAEARINQLTARNDRLSERLDSLREQVDTLRDEIYALRNENLHLKELLLRSNIVF